MRTKHYIAVMMMASGATVARGFIMATLLDQAQFGVYATSVAIGIFFSGLVSFGLVERTIKIYPRLWVEFRCVEAISHADSAGQTLVRRFFFLLPFSVISAYSIGLTVAVGFCVAGVAISTAISGLYASLQRATGDTRNLSISTLFRAVLSVSLATFGAMTVGWYGAILGEIVASILGALVSRRHSVLLTRSNLISDTTKKILTTPEAVTDAKGMWVFWGFLAASVPAYLDRSFVSANFGVALGGTYAFLLLFVAGVNAFAGIVAQKIGPMLIHMERAGDSLRKQVGYTIQWVGFVWLVWLVGLVLLFIGLKWGPLTYFDKKYLIDYSLLPAIAALGCLQVSVFFDFLLLSRDREVFLFSASCSYMVVILLAAAVTYGFRLPMIDFIWLLTFAKLIHVGVQVTLVFWVRAIR